MTTIMALVDYPHTALDRVISFGDHAYPYYVRSGQQAWPELLLRLEELHADHFFLVTEASLPEGLSHEVSRRVSQIACCTQLTFPAGERAKQLTTVEMLAEEALQAGATRRSCILALGGGLAGNVAGLLAALLFRGIRLVHVPTTLLAMSDSVLSLKQAVNSRLGKNHLGTFYTPQFVWNDLAFLRSLPASEIQSALCELIKNVLAIVPQHYAELASLLDASANYSQEHYLRFIDLCVAAKGAVMQNDPFEKGDALVLEYGHTVGHALEVLAQEHLPPGTLPHGCAIGLGMLVAARISRAMGLLSWHDEEMHRELLRRNGAPLIIPRELPVKAMMQVVAHDNKRGYLPAVQGSVPMVLLERLGTPHRHAGTLLTPVPLELLQIGIEALRGSCG